MERSVFQRVQTTIERIGSIAGAISAAMIIVMMLLTVLDVIFRKFGTGITGVVELDGLMLVVIAFFALTHCWNKDGHITIDLFLDRFSPRVRSAAMASGALAGAVFFGAIMWGGIAFAFSSYKEGGVSSNLLIPLYPVKFLLVLGCLLFVFRLLISFIVYLGQTLKRP